ncbi:hypothetical protein ILYODFUR_037608 [Ilyodon furcidens]|uniref:Uncharacterized protein n=1 Tax=Ilyodon furcidens TaxID=33524 RepID=A0ABV0TI06_9TELE
MLFAKLQPCSHPLALTGKPSNVGSRSNYNQNIRVAFKLCCFCTFKGKRSIFRCSEHCSPIISFIQSEQSEQPCRDFTLRQLKLRGFPPHNNSSSSSGSVIN